MKLYEKCAWTSYTDELEIGSRDVLGQVRETSLDS